MASTIKVDNVQNQPGTNVVNKCGTTVNIGAASDNIRSAGNNLQAADGGNLISQSGTTVTLGASGDTVTLASGASQSGFGRAGSVDWDTASIKTATFTAVSGNGYFCNTTGGVFNITMPASPTAGDIVALKDYLGTFATYNLTIDRNGSLLDGEASNKAISANYTSLTLVYVDGTQGWIPTEEGTGFIGVDAAFVIATGGTPCAGATVGDYKVHTFTGPGTFCVSTAGNPGGSDTVDYMVVAGGGGGGGGRGGGGGAGGFRESVPSPAAWTASPIASSGGALPVTVTGYPIDVGGGGSAGIHPSPAATSGALSTFSTISSAGGGRGGNENGPNCGSTGGSGGGSTACTAGNIAGNTPPVSPPQGNASGDNPAMVGHQGNGGGGGTVVGGSSPTCFAGGAGATTCISGTPTAYAGGGGGGGNCGLLSPGGVGGGGAGSNSPAAATPGTINTGGAGGGGRGTGARTNGGAGGSGVVIIRYKFQN